MPQRETRTRGARRASGVSQLWTADAPEDTTETLAIKQAQWITQRLGIKPDLARLVAELAFRGRAV